MYVNSLRVYMYTCTILIRSPRILHSQNGNSAPQEWKFCTKKLKFCTKKYNVEFLCSENANFASQNGSK